MSSTRRRPRDSVEQRLQQQEGRGDGGWRDTGRDSARRDGESKQRPAAQADSAGAGPDADWSLDVKVCSATTLALLLLYLLTLHPSVAGGDSGELIVSASEFGVAHPPGYPLLTLLSKAALVLLPLGSPAWRVNALNALFSAASGGLLQLTVLRLTRCAGSSLLAVSLFSLNRLTWTWSTSAEVFSLNNLFITLLLTLAVNLDSTKDTGLITKKVYMGAFLSGLALTNQHTIVVYVACLALWAYGKLWRNRLLGVHVMLKTLLCALLGLSPYLYLPLSAYLHVARWTWGDQRTPGGFLTHLLRREYGTFDLGKDQDGSGFSAAVGVYMTHLQRSMCELTPWLALIGCVLACAWCAQGKYSCTLVFALMTSLYTALFCWRANLDLNNPLFRGVVERFWMQSDICVAVMAALGCHTAVRMVTEKLFGPAKVSLSSVFTMMAAGICIALQLKNYSQCDQSSNLVVRRFASNILDRLPPNSLVLTKGDLPTNSLRYLHLCEGVRRDIQILDVEILSYDWSLPMLRQAYPRVNFGGDFWALDSETYPDGRRSFNFKTFLDNNYDK